MVWRLGSRFRLLPFPVEGVAGTGLVLRSLLIVFGGGAGGVDAFGSGAGGSGDRLSWLTLAPTMTTTMTR